MELYLNKEADQLIGALIGLARTCNMHLKTKNTDDVILESMATVFRMQEDNKSNILRNSNQGANSKNNYNQKGNSQQNDRAVSSQSVENYSSNPKQAVYIELSNLLQKVREEQLTVAPDCATCPVRCGNTDEYDINLIRNDKKDICDLKMQLLYNACKMAADIMGCQAETVNITADISSKKQEEITQEISQIYKLLCVISYDVDEEFLQRFL